MCHLVRDFERRPFGATQDSLPPSPSRPTLARPRLVGALAALVALAATAALLLLPSQGPTPAQATAAAAATAPVEVGAGAVVPVTVRSGPAIEQTAAGVDDGVPGSTEVARSTPASGHCHHDL